MKAFKPATQRLPRWGGGLAVWVACAPVPGAVPEAEIDAVPVDADIAFDVEAGEGVGVFLEYQTGGLWELFTTCDTNLSNVLCSFDVIVTVLPGEQLSEVRAVELEGNDELYRLDAGAFRMMVLTGGDFDRVWFNTELGQGIRVDALWDGAPDPSLVRWISNGEAEVRQASWPLDLYPSALR